MVEKLLHRHKGGAEETPRGMGWGVNVSHAPCFPCYPSIRLCLHP